MKVPPSAGPVKRFFLHLRAYLFSGILVAAPLVLTLYVAWSAVTAIDSVMTRLLPGRFSLDQYVPFHVPGIGLLTATLIFIVIGWLAAGFFGRFFLSIGERIMDRTPIIRGLYSAIKQIFEAVFQRDKTSFRQVVMLEYPRKGLWTLGFVTGSAKGEVREKGEKGLLSVFIPTTPNPTSGFLLFVPEDEVTLLSMTVEQGIKMVVSAGIVAPPAPSDPLKEKIPIV